jgi:glycosylphosphatidylinositol transamidase (GPIT) subunit GPI8
VYLKTDHSVNLYCNDIEIDYKSDDLTYEAILNLFRGRYDPNFPESKKLKTNSESKVFIYFNGHGGENFFKIQDTEVLQSEDFAKVY